MKINCNVAQDLMQPYVEDILSRDSIEILENHLAGCEVCRSKLDEIRGINQELDGKIEAGAISSSQDYDDDAVTLKDFKKWISFQRLLAIIVTLVLTVTLCVGAIYYAQAYQSYIPFEETGITVDENGVIYTDKAYQMFFGEMYVTDTTGNKAHEIMFIYLTSSFKSRHLEKPWELTIITDLSKSSGQVLGEGDVMLDTEVTEVYYASPKFLKSTKALNFRRELMISPGLSQSEREALVEEMMADSVLLWKRG